MVNVAPQLFINGGWSITPSIADPELKTQVGYSTRGQRQPNKLTWRINNDDDTWRPSNPVSPMYANGGRNIGAAAALAGSVRFWGEASGYTADTSPDFTVSAGPTYTGMRYVDVEAQGVQRRTGQWTETLQSPLTATILGYPTLIGAWPLEDPSTAVSFASSSGQAAAGFTGMTPGQDDSPAGGSSSALYGANALSTFYFKSVPVGDFQVGWSWKGPATLPGTDGAAFWWRSTYAGGGNYWWRWGVSATAFRIQCFDRGVSVLDQTVGFGTGVDPRNWLAYRCKVTTSGTTVKVEPAWYQQGGNGPWGATYTFTGQATALQLARVDQTADNLLNGALIGQVFGVTGGTQDLQSASALSAFDGYNGETAAARFIRLCTENGITGTVVGTPTATVPMGPQKADTFDNLMDEIEASEDALIFDTPTTVGLTMRTRSSRFNQAVKATFAYGSDILPPMPETYGTLAVENMITISNRDGRTFTAIDSTSPMGNQPSPAGVGQYKATYDVNLSADADIANAGAWYLFRGTRPQSNYLSVSIDLAAFPALTTAAQSVTVGDRIQITGTPNGTLDLQVIGWAESAGADTYVITFVCLTNAPFDVGAEDDTTHRLQARASTLQAAATSTATTLSVGTTESVDDTWSTTSTPYPIVIAGELMTVTAATAAATSAPWGQTLTVTRSVNGVIKAQTAGTPVAVSNPYRESW